MFRKKENNPGDAEKIVKTLKEESNFLRNLINTTQAIILVLDPEGKIVSFNPYLEELSGYKLSEVKDKDWFTTFLPKGDHKRIRNIFKGAIKDIQTKGNINPILTKDRQEIFVEWYDKTLKDEDGKVIGLLSIGQDITERKKAEQKVKESEEKYKTLFQTSRDAIMTLNPPSWLFTSGNHSAVEMFKCKDEKDFISYAPFELSPEYQPCGKTSKQKALEMINKAMKEGSNFFEWTHKRATGEEFPATVLLTRVEIEKGKPFLQATVRDITERKKAEQEKQKLQHQLKEYAQKLELKVKKLERNKIKLNQKEKIVLTALTCHPHYNDQQLAHTTNLKRSTITAIRNRLKANHWFKKICIPNLDILNYEVLTCFYLENIEQVNKNKIHITTAIKNSPACLFSQCSDNFAFVFTLYPHITQAHQSFQTTLSNIKLEGLTEKIKQTQFILPFTHLVKFFDYSHILKNLFKLDFKQEKPIPLSHKKLSRNEKELLYALVKFPEANNQKIQGLTRFSKPTIIKIKKKLFSQGYLKQVIIPNVQKLGFSFSSLIYHKFNKPILNKKPQIIQLAGQSKNSFLSLIGDKQILILSVYQDYQQLEKSSLQKKNLYQKMFQTIETPEIFSFQNPKTVKFDFSALIKQAFDFDLDH